MSEKFDDPVVSEIHATRASMLEAAGGDIRLLMQQVAARQRKSNRRIITQPLRRRTKQIVATESAKSRIPNGPGPPATA